MRLHLVPLGSSNRLALVPDTASRASHGGTPVCAFVLQAELPLLALFAIVASSLLYHWWSYWNWQGSVDIQADAAAGAVVVEPDSFVLAG